MKLRLDANTRGSLGHLVGLVVCAIVVGAIVPRLPTPSWLVSPLSPDQVIAFLSAVSSGMMAFTGITFSLLFVLLQFGTTAYSPRIVDILGRDPALYNAAGVFAGTFLYSLAALRGVGHAGDGRTSQAPMIVAFAWLLASMYMLVKLIQSLVGMTHTAVLHRLADTGHAEIHRLYGPLPTDGGDPTRALVSHGLPEGTPQRVLHTGGMRYLVALAVDRLAELARSYGAVIHVPFAIGDPVGMQSPLALIYGSASAGTIPEERVRESIDLARERQLEGNPKYAVRLLVDIAIHALSSAVNDPTTAVQALDQLESLLLHIGQSNLEVGRIHDAKGQLRVVCEATSWDDYVDLSLTEIQQCGAGSVQIERRLAALLAFLAPRVPTPRRASLERWIARRQLSVNAARDMDLFRADAQVGDRQGLGHTSAGPASAR